MSLGGVLNQCFINLSFSVVLNQCFISYPNYMNIVLLAANQALAERLQLLSMQKKDEAKFFFPFYLIVKIFLLWIY